MLKGSSEKCRLKTKTKAMIESEGDFDFDVLAQLRLQVGDAAIGRIVLLFKNDVTRRLELLPELSAAKLGREAHAIKGMALEMGATALADAARSLEQDSSNLTSDEISAYLTRLAQLSVATFAALDSFNPEPAQKPKNGFSDRDVIVVEDCVSTTRLIYELLSVIGVRRIRTYFNANRAVAAIDADFCSTGLIISDLYMPDSDGVEFLRVLKRANYRAGIAVLTSAPQSLVSSVESLASIYCPGFVGVFPKPVTHALLLEILERDALARKAANPAS